MLRRYLRYWREAFDFHSGAYRLDFWWVHIVNTFIFASILFVSIIFFNSWSLATKLSGTFSILITIPNLSLFIRRLRDTGFPVQTIMFVLMKPVTFRSEFWHFSQFSFSYFGTNCIFNILRLADLLGFKAFCLVDTDFK